MSVRSQEMPPSLLGDAYHNSRTDGQPLGISPKAWNPLFVPAS